MGKFLTVIVCIFSLSFILTFNLVGKNWDMGGYSKALDAPANKAFMKPVIFAASKIPAIYFESEDLVLSTAVYGGGLSYKWFFNDQEISQVNSNILIIFGAQKNNAGIYKLVATNELGSTEYKIEVQIVDKEKKVEDPKAAPRILYHTGAGRAVIGKPFSIAVTVTGNRNRFKWYKNGRLITNATSHRLMFTQVKRSDSAEYKVEVTNRAGIDEQKMFLLAEREIDERRRRELD